MPGTSEDSIESSSVSTITTSEQRLPKGDNTGKQRRNTINAMHNMMHDHDMEKWVCWANAITTRWV